MPTTIRQAGPEDAAALSVLAAATFPLACPPSATRESIDRFIAENFSVRNFDSYLADPDRAIFVADVDGEFSGYTMLVFGEPKDPDVIGAISLRPTSELSKLYVLPGHHGAGLASALVAASLEAAAARGAAGMWLGVNDENARANRFYEKSGFISVGTKRFKLGDRYESDFVRERPL